MIYFSITIFNIYQMLNDNDIIISVCNYINDDVYCLIKLSKTNKQIRNVVINTTSYIEQKKLIIDKMHFEKIRELIRIYTESKINGRVLQNIPNNQNKMKDYILKIQEIANEMNSSLMFKLNTIICQNYVDFYEESPPKSVMKYIHEESKTIYTIINLINPQYDLHMIDPISFALLEENNDVYCIDGLNHWLKLYEIYDIDEVQEN